MELLKVLAVVLAVVAVAFTESATEAICNKECELGFQCVLTTEGPDCQATCEVIDCRDGMICIMENVQCKRAPCPPRPICVATTKAPEPECPLKCDSGYNCVSGPIHSICAPTCAVKKCEPHQKCVMKQLRQCLIAPCPPEPVCESKEPPCPLKCDSGYYCVPGPIYSVCAPTCAVKKCEANQKCVMKQTHQCFTAPCPPDPVCEPKTEAPQHECSPKCESGYTCVSGPFHAVCAETCALKTCNPGQKCILKQLRVCVMAPCPPDPVCVPENEAANYSEGFKI